MDISASTFQMIGVLYWFFILGVPLIIIAFAIYIIMSNRKKTSLLQEILKTIKNKEE